MSSKVVIAVLALVSASGARAEVLTVERAVEIALERNVDLASLAADLRTARARLSGAELLFQSNPEVSAAAGPRRVDGRSTTDVELGISQRLEIFGQRAARIDTATADRDGAEARLAARRAEVAAEIRATFARALAADRVLALAREDLAVSRDAAAAVQRRLELGGTSQLELNAARADVGRAARAVAVASRRADLALSALRLLAGIEPAIALQLTGDLSRPREAVTLQTEALVQRALESRADLRSAKREIDAARADARLAGREVLPSPRIGARYSREEDAEIVLATLTLDLPAFNRNQAARGGAAARVTRAEAELAAAERRVREEVLLAASRLSTALEAVRAFEGGTLAGAEANVTLAARAYEAGKIGLAELLLIRRSAVEARRDHVEALEELAEAEADLARAVGSERPVLGGGT